MYYKYKHLLLMMQCFIQYDIKGWLYMMDKIELLLIHKSILYFDRITYNWWICDINHRIRIDNHWMLSKPK